MLFSSWRQKHGLTKLHAELLLGMTPQMITTLDPKEMSKQLTERCRYIEMVKLTDNMDEARLLLRKYWREYNAKVMAK